MRGLELALLWLLLLAAAVQAEPAVAAEPVPDPELLEFIASWKAAAGDRSWFEALDLGMWLAGDSGREEERARDGEKRGR